MYSVSRLVNETIVRPRLRPRPESARPRPKETVMRPRPKTTRSRPRPV